MTLEELLNKLIEKGWKPFGIKSNNIWLYYLRYNKMVISYYEFDSEIGETTREDKWCDLRQIVSKESGLWQFVCENGMVNCDNKNDINSANQKVWHITDYQYRLIESALCDEDKLEKFLLDNIKV